MPKSPSAATAAPAASDPQSAPAGAESSGLDAPPKSFEAALGELERLVAKMESGSLTLEQSLAAHARGLALAKFCQELLGRAEQQVRVLEADMLKSFPSGWPGSSTDDD
jgi:exodeoxyribonuclease VII small subunit